MVNKLLKYFSITTFLFVCFLVLNQNNKQAETTYSYVDQINHLSKPSSISFKAAKGIPLTEIIEIGTYNVSLINNNERVNRYWIFNQIANHLVVIKLKQYFNASLNLLVLHRKTALLFPFHFFW